MKVEPIATVYTT